MSPFNAPINSPLLTCITPLLKDIAPQVYKAKVTLVHRPYLSTGLGGFHPIEVGFREMSKGAVDILYITEFAFSGGPFPE